MSDFARFRPGWRLLSRRVAPQTVGAADGEDPLRGRREDPLRGIGLAVAATVFFSGSDTVAKLLTEGLPPVEIGWIRYMTYVALLLPLLLRAGPAGLKTARPGLQILRGLGVVASAILFILALQGLPIAVATATNFCTPMFITMLSVPMLQEKVGLRRWGAVVVGLIGVLVVVRPGSAAFDPWVVFPVLSSTAWAFAMVFTRRMAGSERVLTTMTWSGFTGLAALTVALPFIWTPIPTTAVLLGILVGVVATTGQLLVVMAYRHAPASVLAPFSYAQLLWSSVAGYFMFGAVPDRWTVLGGSVIAASGLYTAHRERLQAKRRR